MDKTKIKKQNYLLNIEDLSRKEKRMIRIFLSLNTILRILTDNRESLRDRIINSFSQKLKKVNPNYDKKKDILYFTRYRIYNKKLKVYLDLVFDFYGCESLTIRAYEPKDNSNKCDHITDLKTIGNKVFKTDNLNQ